MPRKISIAIDAFRLYDPYSSVAFVVSELVRDLQKNALIEKVVLLLPRQPDEQFMFKDLLELKKVDILYSSTPHFPEKNFRGTIHWIQMIIPDLLKNVRITHFVSPYHQVPILLNKNIKVVTIICDICGILPSAGYPYHKKAPYRHWINFLTALWRSDGFIYISEYTKNSFESFFPSSKNRTSIVIYPKPTITEKVLLEYATQTLTKYQIKYKRFFLAFGHGGIRKGIDLSLMAFSIYQSRGGTSNLVVLAPESIHNHIKKVAPQNLRNLVLIGNITNKERDSLYAGAAALVFPSRCEGYGYPIIEAMYQGCPPIAFGPSPAREIIGDCLPTLEKLEPECIADMMLDFENNFFDGKSMSVQSRASQFLNEINASSKYTEILQAVM